jgi:hypothetical protein
MNMSTSVIRLTVAKLCQNAIDFGRIGQISKFLGLDRADAVQPASISASLTVIARITSSGGIPAARKLTNVATLAWPRIFPG